MSTISPGADESWLVFEQKAAFDEKKQAVYYYNTASGETTWQKPRESEAAAASDVYSEGVLGVFLPWACVQRGDMYVSECVYAIMNKHECIVGVHGPRAARRNATRAFTTYDMCTCVGMRAHTCFEFSRTCVHTHCFNRWHGKHNGRRGPARDGARYELVEE